MSVKVNGDDVPSSAYAVTPTSLTLTAPPPGPYELRIVVNIKPQENTALEGLYKSGGNYCTQCEAQGFRHITYFPDRPDVMAKYTTRIEADCAAYPVLLGNGNLVEEGNLGDGRCVRVCASTTACVCERVCVKARVCVGGMVHSVSFLYVTCFLVAASFLHVEV